MDDQHPENRTGFVPTVLAFMRGTRRSIFGIGADARTQTRTSLSAGDKEANRRKFGLILVTVLLLSAVVVAVLVYSFAKSQSQADCTNQRRNAQDCLDLLRTGFETSGVYSTVVADGTPPVQVYCEQETDGGGWMVIQRRNNHSTNFYRNWNDYRNGFGEKNNEYWLGLKLIHTISKSRPQELRIDLEDFDGEKRFAKYQLFEVGSEQTSFRLTVRNHTGNIDDSLSYHNGRAFSTRDRDNDGAQFANCAALLQGGWWYDNCWQASLNGLYGNGSSATSSGIGWSSWKGCKLALKRSKMMIRPA